MKKPLLLKFIVMGAIALVLLIPISLIYSIIKERGYYRDSVIRDIQDSTSYAQQLGGPILVVPYTKTVTEWRKTKDNKGSEAFTTKKKGKLLFLPGELKVSAQMKTELRQRGIYQAPLYHADIKMRGHFNLPQDYGINEGLEKYEFHAPFVVVSISDMRGIKSAMALRFGEEEKAVKPGTNIEAFTSGVHAAVFETVAEPDKAGPVNFNLSFKLQGTTSLSVFQLGEETEIEMISDWPHPSFRGRYLPTSHEISDEGFSAHWFSSHFSTNISQNLPDCARGENCESLFSSAAMVELVTPVDHYVKSDRAMKYALLFICLTFAGFFLFEVLKQLKIHPIQYLLVGVSLAAFYMLLISLSEHVGFAWAYLVSAIACISLIGFYLVHILKGAVRALLFSAALGLLYALLYGVLGSEDYALLMGTTLLFAVLSLFMIATRKLDWYAASKAYLPPASEPAAPIESQ